MLGIKMFGAVLNLLDLMPILGQNFSERRQFNYEGRDTLAGMKVTMEGGIDMVCFTPDVVKYEERVEAFSSGGRDPDLLNTWEKNSTSGKKDLTTIAILPTSAFYALQEDGWYEVAREGTERTKLTEAQGKVLDQVLGQYFPAQMAVTKQKKGKEKGKGD